MYLTETLRQHTNHLRQTVRLHIASEPDQRTIRIIQNGKASNADVQAVLYKDGAKQEAAAIGKLNQTINEFAVGKDSQILEVIVTWAEDIPEISIIKTSEKEKAAVNKDALNEAIKKPIDDKWTADSKRAAEEAKAAAEEIAANEYVTQEVVDLAEKALLAAHKNAVVKGDVTALENALNNMKAGKEKRRSRGSSCLCRDLFGENLCGI